MTKTNATVSVMPVRDNPNATVLRIFRMTMEEYLLLKLCASAPRTSDCTAKQRLLFRRLQEQARVDVIEYPCLDAPRWTLSASGRAIIDAAALLLTGIKSGPAEILQFPLPGQGAGYWIGLDGSVMIVPLTHPLALYKMPFTGRARAKNTSDFPIPYIQWSKLSLQLVKLAVPSQKALPK